MRRRPTPLPPLSAADGRGPRRCLRGRRRLYRAVGGPAGSQALGHDVVLVEAHRVGFGASGRNGGQVGSGQRLDQGTLERMAGRDAAAALWDIAEAAKAEVARLIADHAIDAAYRPGVAHASYARADLAHEAAEAERLARGLRLRPDRAAGPPPASPALTGSEAFSGGTLDRGAGHLHPLRFALGLARAAAAAGVRIHEGSTVTGLDPGRVSTAAGQRRRAAGGAGRQRLSRPAGTGECGAGDADQQLHRRHRTAGPLPRDPARRRRGGRQQVRGQLLAAQSRQPAAVRRRRKLWLPLPAPTSPPRCARRC